MARRLLAFLLLGLLASPALAQAPRGPSALLHVRFVGSPGMKVAFYRDPAGPREFDVPVTVGLRPGYVYQVKITGLPGRPRDVLCPTLEVRGSLFLSPKQSPADHPAPLVFGDLDVERALDGALVTKVVYLEHPDLAFPTATRPDQPVEVNLAPSRDLLAAAREFGRPMVVVRFGERPADEEELRKNGIAGTILFPAEKSLMPPRVPPCLPWARFNPADPFLGPKMPDEECLQDGGDVGRKAGIAEGGKVGGLDPSDTVAEYTDGRGQRRLSISNRVCLCVPRFAVFRTETGLAGTSTLVGPDDARAVLMHGQASLRLPSKTAHQYEQPVGVKGKRRPSEMEAQTSVARLVRLDVLEGVHVYEGPALWIGTTRAKELRELDRAKLNRLIVFARGFAQRSTLHELDQQVTTTVVGRVDGLKLVTSTAEPCDLTGICAEPPQVLLDRPLLLVKWADRDAAQIGDVVTFYLKYSNRGGQAISDVAVSDSLTGRLEYVPGSAKSDRNTVFTIQQNEAGSVVLRWEVSGKLMPCEQGVVSFQARIR